LLHQIITCTYEAFFTTVFYNLQQTSSFLIIIFLLCFFIIQNPCSKEFIRIGRYYCCYKGFHDSLKPREYLNSEVMNVWVENFNYEAKNSCSKEPKVQEKVCFQSTLCGKSPFSFFVLCVHKQMDFHTNSTDSSCRIRSLLTLLHSTSMVA
jgi:hypothetical protein